MLPQVRPCALCMQGDLQVPDISDPWYGLRPRMKWIGRLSSTSVLAGIQSTSPYKKAGDIEDMHQRIWRQ